MLLLHASKGELNLDSEGVRCIISTLESEKSPKFEDFMFCRTTFTIWFRKFTLSTNFDSWFTYCVLSQQNWISVDFVLWLFWLRKFSAWRSKIAFNPPPPPPSLLLLAINWILRNSIKERELVWVIELSWPLENLFNANDNAPLLDSTSKFQLVVHRICESVQKLRVKLKYNIC